MGSVPSALAFLRMIFAGWVNRHQLIAIDLLKAGNRILKERLRGSLRLIELLQPIALYREGGGQGN
jgi:hypothetical protein